jgi:microcystin-dependent protein
MSSVPPDYVKAASFTTLAQQPITMAGLPGTQLDNEFVNIANTVNKTIDRLSELQQDDGKLRSNVVTIGSLSPDTAAAIAAAGSTIYGEWVAGKAYKPGDIIIYGSDSYAYMAAVAHTSGTDFNADFSNKAWAILGWRPTTSNLIVKTFTGNGSQLTFALLVNPVSETNTQVFVNGVYKSKSTYDISGTNLVFTAGNAPANAAAIEVVIGVAAELINNIVNIPNNSVGTTALINLAVTGAKIADTTITTGKIADQAITADKIENNTITSGKIQDLSIIESKLANAAVTGQKIATGTIIESNLADASVGTTKIAAGAILNSKMAANSVGSTNVIDGSITKEKLASDIQIPVGMILPRAVYGDTAGWLFCGGAEVSRTTYAALFALIGTTYGSGNGSTTFNVPDLRSKFIRGELTGTTASIGATQASNVGSHTHDVAVEFNQDNNNGNVSLSGDPSVANQYKLFTTGTGSQPGETRPINMSMPYYIKY